MPATLSVMGLYNYDNTILDPLTDAMPDESLKSVIVECLFSECAELEVIYPAPTVFKTILTAWCQYRKKIWLDLWNTTNLEYNPINNYDRTETETVKTDKTGNATSSGSNANTHSDNTNISGQNGTVTRTENRYGFNSSSVDVPVAKAVETPGQYTSNQNSTSNDSGTNAGNSSIKENESITRSLRNYGNIGVTTTQQMIQQERDIVKYDIVDDIINDFKAKFCLMVY